MDILSYIQTYRPGVAERGIDRIEISHNSGDCSTLWLNNSHVFPDNLAPLGELFAMYDGMDLFSSTFKIASISERKIANGVAITFALPDIQSEFLALNPTINEEVVPFMVQAGIGIYALGLSSGKIIEWDIELNEHTATFDSLEDILEEWLGAIES